MIPISYFLPSNAPSVSSLFPSTHPLLITSDAPVELVVLALTYGQQLASDDRLVLITSRDPASLLPSLETSLLTSASSPLTSVNYILASRSITLYHVETLADLRVLLSSLQHSKISFLGIDNSISLHESASELSAQGISRTVAAMVDIASSSKGVLVLNESYESVERSVPVLNPGLGSGLGHSTVPIIRVLGRWVRGFWKQGPREGDCFAEWTCQREKQRVRWTLHDGEIDDVQITTL
jgi:hypothetical protein